MDNERKTRRKDKYGRTKKERQEKKNKKETTRNEIQERKDNNGTARMNKTRQEKQ